MKRTAILRSRFSSAQSRSGGSFFLGLARTFLAAAIFLVPIFVIPGLTDLQELPKAALMLILTLGATVSWALAWVTSGSMHWRRIPGWSALAVFGLGVILSWATSIARTASLYGLTGYVHDTAPMVLAGVLFVVIAVQVFDQAQDVRNIVFIIMTSLGLAGLQAILQAAGASPLPVPSLQDRQMFVTGNSAVGLSVLMSVLVVLSITAYTSSKQMLWKLLSAVAGLVGILVLFAVDAMAGWVTLLIGVTVTLIALSMKPLPRLHLAISGVIVLIGILGLLVPTSGIVRTHIGRDVLLDGRTTWSVASQSFAKRPFTGSGPGTFYYDFLSHRPASFNQTALSGLSFLKGSDEIMTMVTTMGLVALIGFAGLIALVAFSFLRSFERLSTSATMPWGVTANAFGVFAGMFTALFFSPGTMSIMFLFWTALAVVMIMVSDGSKARSVSAPVTRTLGTTTFLAASLLLIVFIVWPIRMMIADRELVNVNTAIQQTEDLTKVTARIDRAIQLTPYNPLPYFMRAQADLVQAQLAAQQKQNDQATSFVNMAIQDAERGVARDPKNAVLYSTLGAVYKSAGSFVGGVGDKVLAAYTTAASLDPNNAKAHIDLGQVEYLVAAATKGQKDAPQDGLTELIQKAETEFHTALILSPGNADAGFGLVLVDELNGKNDEAYAKLTALVQAYPQSAALQYELGVRQHARKDVTAAKATLQTALSLEPNLTAAHIELAKIAKEANDIATARREYQAALSIDPNNQEAQTGLDALPKS